MVFPRRQEVSHCGDASTGEQEPNSSARNAREQDGSRLPLLSCRVIADSITKVAAILPTVVFLALKDFVSQVNGLAVELSNPHQRLGNFKIHTTEREQ